MERTARVAIGTGSFKRAFCNCRLEVTAMNLLLGLILGVLLTIGTHETTSAVATGWERLKGGVKSLE